MNTNAPFGPSFPYQGVSLDIDGTLYSLAWFKFHLCFRRGRDLKFWIAMENARKQIRRQRLRHHDMHQHVIDIMSQDLRLSTSDTAAIVLRLLDVDWPFLLSKVGPYPGISRMLSTLADAKIPVVLNSDYPGTLKSRGLGLGEFPFRAIIDATSYNALKPRPEAFQAAVDLLGLPPESILHVGDSLELDILGAASVGMHTALVGRGGTPPSDPVAPNWRFSSTARFARAVIDSLSQPKLLPRNLDTDDLP